MLSAIVISTQGYDSIVNILNKSSDTVTVDHYKTIEQLIRMSKSKGIIYDRIILISTALNTKTIDKDFNSLNTYLTSESPRTLCLFVISTVSRSDNDSKKLDSFYNHFNSLLYIDIAVAQTTIQVINDLFTKDRDTLSKQYSQRVVESAEVLDDFIAVDTNVDKTTTTVQVVDSLGIKSYGSIPSFFQKKKHQKQIQANANINTQLLLTLQ